MNAYVLSRVSADNTETIIGIYTDDTKLIIDTIGMLDADCANPYQLSTCVSNLMKIIGTKNSIEECKKILKCMNIICIKIEPYHFNESIYNKNSFLKYLKLMSVRLEDIQLNVDGSKNCVISIKDSYDSKNEKLGMLLSGNAIAIYSYEGHGRSNYEGVFKFDKINIVDGEYKISMKNIL